MGSLIRMWVCRLTLPSNPADVQYFHTGWQYSVIVNACLGGQVGGWVCIHLFKSLKGNYDHRADRKTFGTLLKPRMVLETSHVIFKTAKLTETEKTAGQVFSAVI